MLAAVLHEPGPPDIFRFEDLPVPEPAMGEVLVRVHATGVSGKDVVERNGTFRRDVVFPLVIGLEIAGEVVQVGPGVTRLAPGDRVCTKAFSSCGDCRYCRTGRETTCRRRKPVRGGYAEYAALAEDACVAIPPALSYEAACMLGPGAGVALNAVRDTAHVEAGDTVLVTGATGGVGLPAVQIAKLAGARVIAVTRSMTKREFLLEQGVDVVLAAAAGEDFSRALRPLTRDSEGVDVVIDTVGSAVFDAAFNSLAPHGRYAFVGQLNGDSIRINPARIFFKRAQLLGVGSVSRRQLEDAVAMAASGQIRSQVARVMSLRDLPEAHRLVEEGHAAGRIVVTPLRNG